MRRIRFGRILCPVDFSPLSRAAFDRACALAREHRAELRLLYVLEPGEKPFARELGGATHETLMHRLRKFLRDGNQEGVQLGAAIREGQPAREILRMATRFSADLIVMGAGRGATHDDEGRVNHAGLGHVARVVADRALCPVLMVPRSAARAPLGSFRQIVCATDTDPASVTVVGQALSLAQEAQGCVTLVHVEPERSEEDLYTALAAVVPDEALNWCEARVVVTSGNPATTIVEIADSVAADLIVVGAPRAIASVSHAVVANAACPVLIAHDTPGQVFERVRADADLAPA